MPKRSKKLAESTGVEVAPMRLGAINQPANRGSFVKGDDSRRNPGGRPVGAVGKITRTIRMRPWPLPRSWAG